MYQPTEEEKSTCYKIVKALLPDSEVEKVAEEAFKIAYSIGGDYGESTLTAIVKAMFVDN